MRTLILLILSFAVLPFGANAATLTTTFAGGNGFAGNMFDVTNLSGGALNILGTFDVHLDDGITDADISVYYRSGGYVGFESDGAGWTLLGSDTVDSAGLGNATAIDVGNTMLIGAGETFGFYVSWSNYAPDNGFAFVYSDGANVYDDGVLQITTGIGKGNPDFTGGTFSPRTWNGSIDYDTNLSSVPEPTTWTLMLGGVAALAAMRRRRA